VTSCSAAPPTERLYASRAIPAQVALLYSTTNVPDALWSATDELAGVRNGAEAASAEQRQEFDRTIREQLVLAPLSSDFVRLLRLVG
jgi:hypothetical protein